MKRIKPFCLALLLFFITIFGIHCAFGRYSVYQNADFGKLISQNKFAIPELMGQNLDDNSIVLLGSSELKHGQDTDYHPGNVFTGTDLNVMCIGSAHYQTLYHAINLAAIEPYMKKRKVVLILSPQWFRKGGVEDKAFSMRFSELAYVDMLKQNKLKSTTKQYIMDRTHDLLDVDPKMLCKVKEDERVATIDKVNKTGKASLFDYLNQAYRLTFLRDKYRIQTTLDAKYMKVSRNKPTKEAEYDFKGLDDQAGIEGEENSKTNEFNILDRYYKEKMLPKLARKKNADKGHSYAESEEYTDLKYFLKVCKELKIEPMLVMIPVNGWWYDYTGFSREGRDEYYANIRKMAKKHKVKLLDYADKEYTKYFLEDAIHVGWKGWVAIDEEIRKFAE